MTSGLARAAEANLYYQVDGDGPQTLVLVNGVGDPLEGWANQLDDFLAAGLRVVSFDNRGVGRSSQPPGPYTSAQMAADLNAVVSAIGLADFHLAGVSMGGVIAQEYALAGGANLRSLVLANTFAAADPFTRAAFETWAPVAQAAGMPMMMRAQAPWIFSPEFYAQHPERVAELIAEAQESTQPAAAFAAQMAALADHDCPGPARDADHADAGHRGRRRHHHPARAVPAAVRGAARRRVERRSRRSCRVLGEPRAVESGRHRVRPGTSG